MAAKIGEEIGIERNGLRRQHAFGGGEEFCLGLVARLFLRLGGIGSGKFNLLQASVDLAGGEFRQAFDARTSPEPYAGRLCRSSLRKLSRRFRRPRRGTTNATSCSISLSLRKTDGGLRNARRAASFGFDFAHSTRKPRPLIVDRRSSAMEHDLICGDLHRIRRTCTNRISASIQERISDEFLAGEPVAAHSLLPLRARR